MILEVRSAVDETREHGGEIIVGRMKDCRTLHRFRLPQDVYSTCSTLRRET